jgi:hypothetical protein
MKQLNAKLAERLLPEPAVKIVESDLVFDRNLPKPPKSDIQVSGVFNAKPALP